jgi:hypothetical protein
MRTTSLALLSVLAAAACVRGTPRIEPVPASSMVQSEFTYRRVHSSAGRFITADVLSANGDLPLESVLHERLVGFESSTGARPSPPNGNAAWTSM